MILATYDAVKWHILTKEKVPLNVALLHFRVALDWLGKKDLLTDIGKEKSKQLDRNFELTDDMLTPLGNAILMKGYNAWVQQVDYKKRPKMVLFDRLYMLLKNKINDKKDVDKQVKTTYNTAVDNTIANTSTTGPQTNPNMVQPVNEITSLLHILYKEIKEF